MYKEVISEERVTIKDDHGHRLCDFVREGTVEYLEFKQGRRFDTLQLDSLFDQMRMSYSADSCNR